MLSALTLQRRVRSHSDRSGSVWGSQTAPIRAVTRDTVTGPLLIDLCPSPWPPEQPHLLEVRLGPVTDPPRGVYEARARDGCRTKVNAAGQAANLLDRSRGTRLALHACTDRGCGHSIGGSDGMEASEAHHFALEERRTCQMPAFLADQR